MAIFTTYSQVAGAYPPSSHGHFLSLWQVDRQYLSVEAPCARTKKGAGAQGTREGWRVGVVPVGVGVKNMGQWIFFTGVGFRVYGIFFLNFSRSVDFWCEENGIQKVSLNLLDVDNLWVTSWDTEIPQIFPQTFRSKCREPASWGASQKARHQSPLMLVFLMDGNGENNRFARFGIIQLKQPLNNLGGDLKYFLIFIPIWRRFPFWLLFFRVETTN